MEFEVKKVNGTGTDNKYIDLLNSFFGPNIRLGYEVNSADLVPVSHNAASDQGLRC